MKPFRRWLANKLAGLARRIYPESEEAMAFLADRMMDMVLTGQSTIKIAAVPPEEILASGPTVRWNPNTSRFEPYNACDDQGMSKK